MTVLFVHARFDFSTGVVSSVSCSSFPTPLSTTGILQTIALFPHIPPFSSPVDLEPWGRLNASPFVSSGSEMRWRSLKLTSVLALLGYAAFENLGFRGLDLMGR